MPNSKKINREVIEHTPWGSAYLREMDLILAATELASAKLKKTAYNDDVNLMAASRLIGLDGAFEEMQIDTVRIPTNDENPWKRLPDALQAIKGLPRGHWAVFEMDGSFDAYMSDGCGGTGTQTGQKFTKNSASAPAFNSVELYSHVISSMTYIRRNQIRNEIMEHSFAVSDVQKGSLFQDMRFNGKEYSKIEVDEILGGYYSGEGDAVRVKATRRGVKPSYFIIPAGDFAQRAGVEILMPPQYEDAENFERLVGYLREEAAEPLAGMHL